MASDHTHTHHTPHTQTHLEFKVKVSKLKPSQKTKKVPLENVTRVPCVKYLSPRMNRKKTADNHRHRQTDNRQTEATTILEMQNLHFK